MQTVERVQGVGMLKENGIYNVWTTRGYGIEEMREVAEEGVYQLNREGKPYVIQTGLSAADVNREVVMLEDLVAKKGVGRDWCLVSVSVIVFEDEEKKKEWENGEKVWEV